MIDFPLLLVAAGIILNVVAIFAYQWVTLAPVLGIQMLYHLRPIRYGLAAFALSLAAGGLLLEARPATAIGFAVAVLLAPLSGAQHARRFLVPLDAPQHLRGDARDLEPEVEVVGAVIDGQPIAWPLDIMIPHHIVNDRINGVSVAATW